MARLALLALVALCLAPGAWWRTHLPEARDSRLSFTPLAIVTPQGWPDGLSLERLWQLQSPDPFFGGYSALLPLERGRLRAYSDKGDSLTFTVSGRGRPEADFASVAPDPRRARQFQDIEAVASDPATGRHWLSYEHLNAIRRYEPGEGPRDLGTLALPPQMRDWPVNSGGEAMVRLADGRFVVLAERGGKGLLFAGDPVDGARGAEFAVTWPDGYRPADAAVLPDGRVLVLMRKVVPAWPAFRSLLLIGDPRAIGGDRPWQPQLVARLDGLLPSENYEAIAVEPDGDSLVLWLISDDNLATFQRTLLARLRWRP